MHFARIVPLLAVACLGGASASAATRDSASVHRGKALAQAYGCAGCHRIPGLSGRADVGPPLSGIGRRVYIAGVLPNTPQNMARWIVGAQDIRPGDAMPSTRMPSRDAADLAAFLASLR